MSKGVDYITQLLRHCTQAKNVRAIKELHAHVLRTGLVSVSYNLYAELIYSYNTLLNANNHQTLTSCFKSINPTNPLAFNVIISDFCRNGSDFLALKTLTFMHSHGVPIDTYPLCNCITASFCVSSLEFGKQIHAHVAKTGWFSSVFVGSALVDLYAGLSSVNDAGKVFDEIPVKNTVCANALLSGYCEANLWAEGLELVKKMPLLNLDYDQFTLSAILSACTGLSAIELGRQVHAYLIRKTYNMGSEVFLQSSLIECYGKCGMLDKALRVFNLAGIRPGGKRRRDVVLWTSMLGVCGKNGHFQEVIGLYKEMLMEGIRPDGVAFLTVLSACAHTGQVNLGLEFFESMTWDYKLSPGPEHYSCLIDLLCRAGELDKAVHLINERVRKGHESDSLFMWASLLSSCTDRGNIELGKLAAQRALELDPENVGICVMLSKLYARFGMWDEIEQLRELINRKRLKKDVGCSWIEVTSSM